MPYFFQFSKNGRKALYNRNAKKKTYAKINNSTMNRLSKRFNDIGQINMNVAGIPPFNWQMLMSADTGAHLNQEESAKLISTFCDMDSANLANVIEAKEYEDMSDKDAALGYSLVSEAIVQEMETSCGSLEAAYPHILKYLFTGDNFHKSSHKQMFWRVFGDIALKNLEENLSDYYVCKDCGAKIPSRYENHLCLKNTHGYLECVDCGAITERTYSRQCRCEACRKEHIKIQRREQNSRHYNKKVKSLQANDREREEAK